MVLKSRTSPSSVVNSSAVSRRARQAERRATHVSRLLPWLREAAHHSERYPRAPVLAPATNWIHWLSARARARSLQVAQYDRGDRTVRSSLVKFSPPRKGCLKSRRDFGECVCFKSRDRATPNLPGWKCFTEHGQQSDLNPPFGEPRSCGNGVFCSWLDNDEGAAGVVACGLAPVVWKRVFGGEWSPMTCFCSDGWSRAGGSAVEDAEGRSQQQRNTTERQRTLSPPTLTSGHRLRSSDPYRYFLCVVLGYRCASFAINGWAFFFCGTSVYICSVCYMDTVGTCVSVNQLQHMHGGNVKQADSTRAWRLFA